MSHLCGIDTPKAPLEVGPGLRGKLARVLWRRTMPPEDAELAEMRKARSRQTQMSRPAAARALLGDRHRPAADRGHRHRRRGVDRRGAGGVAAARLVRLRPPEDPRDRQAADRRTATACPTRSARSIDDVVRDPRGRYVMAVGGDTHNYQRYPGEAPRRAHDPVRGQRRRGRLHARHAPDRARRRGRRRPRSEFKCYPLRSDSLARFSELYDERLARGSKKLVAARRPRRRPTSASCWT